MFSYVFKMKEIREKQGISQRKLAMAVKSTQAKISNYENGQVSPSLDRLVEIAAVLGVTLDELVEFKEIHHNYSKEIKDKLKMGNANEKK